MTQHGQTTAKEHYYDWYNRKNNQCCYNRLIFENSIKIIKIRNKEWKTDEGWSYEWCKYYTIVANQIVTNEKAGVIEIRNLNTSMILILQ